jgi:hypothetical protein
MQREREQSAGRAEKKCVTIALAVAEIIFRALNMFSSSQQTD